MKISFIATVVLVLTGTSAMAEGLSTGKRFQRVIQIVFENTSYEKALADPNFGSLAKKGALLTNLIAETHPSQGNYIAMIAGDNLGVRSDKNIDLNERQLGDLLEAARLNWRVYAEDFPGNCYIGTQSGNYVRKHNPFISFASVNKNPSRCAAVEDATNFERDFAAGNLPTFSFFVPNLKNDGHDTGVGFAGTWFANKFNKMLNNSVFMKETIFLITFDESEGAGPNHVFTVLVGGSVKPGSQSNAAFTHASLLRLVEDEFNLGSLGKQDLSSNVIEGIWN